MRGRTDWLPPVLASQLGMRMRVEFERKEDGPCIAEIRAVPGALCYASSQKEAKW
jgi:hypothetical protein